MYDTSQDLLNALGATPEIVAGLLTGVPEARVREARGGDENWNVIEVLCHLRDAEERSIERLRAMRDEQDPFLPGYDQDAWAVERDYTGQDLARVLAEFVRLRSIYLAELAALAAEDWERPGQHEEAGQITIKNHANHMASHDAIHAAQIARQLAQPL